MISLDDPRRARRVIASVIAVAGDLALAAAILKITESELLRVLVALDRALASPNEDHRVRTDRTLDRTLVRKCPPPTL